MRTPDQILKHVGKAIRERRKQLGYSQLHVAERVGIHTDIVSRIENGRNCRLNTLLSLMQYLELELVFK